MVSSDYQNYKPALIWAAILAVSLGLLSLTIAEFIPKHAPLLAVSLAVVTLLAIGILAIVQPPQ